MKTEINSLKYMDLSPQILIEKNLSSNAKILLLFMKSKYNLDQFSYQYASNSLDFSVRTISRAISELKKFGYLKTRKIGGWSHAKGWQYEILY